MCVMLLLNHAVMLLSTMYFADMRNQSYRLSVLRAKDLLLIVVFAYMRLYPY
jgi:hypothetical protein